LVGNQSAHNTAVIHRSSSGAVLKKIKQNRFLARIESEK
jgi:hypothetical protein